MKVKFCVIVLIEIALVILLLVINLKKIERFAPAIGESLTFGRASPTLRSACKVQCNPTLGQFCPDNIPCDKDKLECLSDISCCCPTPGPSPPPGPIPPPPPPPPPGPIPPPPPPPPGGVCRDQMNPDVLAEGCPAMCGPGVSCCGFDG